MIAIVRVWQIFEKNSDLNCGRESGDKDVPTENAHQGFFVTDLVANIFAHDDIPKFGS
jgi:hypothetical protein